MGDAVEDVAEIQNGPSIFSRYRAIIAVVTAVLLYSAIVLAVANTNRDWGLNDSRPRFQTPPPASLPGIPTSDDLQTSIFAFRPTSFDEESKRLLVEVQLIPAATVGEAVGDSFAILGNRVLLQFPGAVLQAENGGSSILLEGSGSVVSNALLTTLREVGPPYSSMRSSKSFTDTLEANARTRLEDVHLFSSLDVSVSSQTYGRPFRATDNTFWFPFDSYGFSLNLIANRRPLVDIYREEINSQNSDKWVMPFVLVPNRGAVGANDIYNFQVGNWQLRSRPTHFLGAGGKSSLEETAESWEVGLGTVLFHARRPFSIRILAGVFGLVYIASSVALLVVVKQISCALRPPTGNMLVWAAALIFASVSLRQGLPGDIPVGVLFDWVLFFPTLLVSISSTLFLAVKWVQRADYTP